MRKTKRKFALFLLGVGAFTEAVYEFIFDCHHPRLMAPITLNISGKPKIYVSCFTCGKRMEYDWKTMSIVSKSEMVRLRKQRYLRS
jgi:hypothetical protein